MADAVADEIEELLTEKQLIAYLGTSVDDRPHVAPLWFRYEDGVVEMSTSGRKVENIRENPRVAIAVGEEEDGSGEWMVTLRGTAEVIEDEEEIEAANQRLYDRYDTDGGAQPDNVLVRVDVASSSHLFLGGG